jgi:hypothetical protein
LLSVAIFVDQETHAYSIMAAQETWKIQRNVNGNIIAHIYLFSWQFLPNTSRREDNSVYIFLQFLRHLLCIIYRTDCDSQYRVGLNRAAHQTRRTGTW